MNVPGSAPVRVPARMGALAGAVLVRSPGLPEPAPAQRSGGPPGSLAEEPFERVARSATMVPDTPPASVTVTGQRSTSGRICIASPDMQGAGRLGTLLGLLPGPGLHYWCCLLRAGDSLILFTGGATEPRRHIGRSRYGDSRLHDFAARLGSMAAARPADAGQQAVLSFRGAGSPAMTRSRWYRGFPGTIRWAARARGRLAAHSSRHPAQLHTRNQVCTKLGMLHKTQASWVVGSRG